MLAETVLSPVLQLVAALSPKGKGVTLHLLRVIAVPGKSGTIRGQTRIDTLLSEHERQEAQEYLEAVVKRLQEEAQDTMHLSFTTSVIIRPDVAGTILQEAEKGPCDLIALATHGRSGLMRALMGSVTERVVGHTTLPLLVTRPLKSIVEPEKIEDVRDDEQLLSSWVGLL
jgi:nucleotide-binding universal stress UspA family protein